MMDTSFLLALCGLELSLLLELVELVLCREGSRSSPRCWRQGALQVGEEEEHQCSMRALPKS